MDYASRPGRHIVALSGGKDSTALAIFLRDKIPQLEYVFCDTGEELPETYDYLSRLEAYLGRAIVRIKATRTFREWLDAFGGFLPSPQARWCTRELKIKPFEAYVGDDPVWSYIGIRADEQRQGYISRKPTITPVYPFKEHGLGLSDIVRILEESGLGLPMYYAWRSRSGCYFCFFQRIGEWRGLYERHPDLFQKAADFEKPGFTWRREGAIETIALRKGWGEGSQMRLFDDDDDESACEICR